MAQPHPSLGRLAAIRGVDKRSVRRHLAQLERAGLITRQERPGKPSLLVIEDPSTEETQRYLETFDAIRELATSLTARSGTVPPDKAKREYLAQAMVRVLGDRHSLGC